MKNWNERITDFGKKMVIGLLLAVLLVSSIPAEQVQASTYSSFYWSYDLSDYSNTGINSTLTVEKGVASLNMGDFFYISRSGTLSDSTVRSKFSPVYSSSNTKVATINKSTGAVKTLKTGSTNITVKLSGKKYVCTLNVIASSSKGTNANKIIKRLNTLNKKKITSSNRASYINELGSILKTVLSKGFAEKNPSNSNSYYWIKDTNTKQNVCYVTNYELYNECVQKMVDYQWDCTSHYFNTASAKKGSKKITIKMNGKLTSSDVFAWAQLTQGCNYKNNPSSVKQTVNIVKKCNSKTESCYDYTTGTVTFKKGASSFTVTAKKTLTAGRYAIRIYKGPYSYTEMNFKVK